MAEERPRERHCLHWPYPEATSGVISGCLAGRRWARTGRQAAQLWSQRGGEDRWGCRCGKPGLQCPAPPCSAPTIRGFLPKVRATPLTCSESQSCLPYPQTSGEGGGGGRKVRKKATGGPEMILPGLYLGAGCPARAFWPRRPLQGGQPSHLCREALHSCGRESSPVCPKPCQALRSIGRGSCPLACGETEA